MLEVLWLRVSSQAFSSAALCLWLCQLLGECCVNHPRADSPVSLLLQPLQASSQVWLQSGFPTVLPPHKAEIQPGLLWAHGITLYSKPPNARAAILQLLLSPELMSPTPQNFFLLLNCVPPAQTSSLMRISSQGAKKKIPLWFSFLASFHVPAELSGAYMQMCNCVFLYYYYLFFLT